MALTTSAIVPCRRVYPSGADFETISAATVPECPPRLSAITCWPNDAASLVPTARAMTSAAPPGGKPMTRRTGFDGYSCAAAPAASVNTHTTAAKIRRGRNASLVTRHPSRESRLRLEARSLDHLGPLGELGLDV